MTRRRAPEWLRPGGLLDLVYILVYSVVYMRLEIRSPPTVFAGRRAFFTGGGEGSRTPDTGIFSPLLYQLSYPTKGLLLQARLLYQTVRKRQRESLQCRENHRVEPR